MPNPFLVEAEKVFAGVRFDVHALDLPRRSGGTMRREVVVPPNSVVILPLLEGPAPAAMAADSDAPAEARVVLIRNQRFAVGQSLLELPAGTMEPGEDPMACAARELTEETGYVAERLTRLIEFYPTPGFCSELMAVYRAQNLRLEQQQLDETEQITTEVVDLDESIQMIKDNRIRDAKTIAALLFYAMFERNQV